MGDVLTREELTSLQEGMSQWGPVGQPNWCDPKGESIPVPKVTMTKLLAAAARGLDGFEMDRISHAEAHGDTGK